MPHRSVPGVLDVWSHIHPRFGGIGPAALALAEAVQSSWDCLTRQIAVCSTEESREAPNVEKTLTIIPSGGARPLADASIGRNLEPAVLNSDVCHVHGLWEPHSLAVRRIAKQLRKPIVSSVHGMLEHWELRNKGMKKKVYSAFFERPSLAQSACLRALSAKEANDYRRFGLQNPIAVIPNGIRNIERVNPNALLIQFPQLKNKRIVLFLGRIHHKKGILRLLESWSTVTRNCPDAHLLIAGSEYGHTGTQIHRLIRTNRIETSVTCAGVLSGYAKVAALSAATCFCLPSYSEGMSIAVLEALSIGLPVVVTHACNVDGVEGAGAGYICTTDPDTIASGVSKCLSLTNSEWQAMSSAARILARQRFDWSIVGEDMALVYQWILGGAKPKCILN